MRKTLKLAWPSRCGSWRAYLHLVTGQYEPLTCAVCEKDLLQELFTNDQCGNLIEVHGFSSTPNEVSRVCVACKGDCDREVQRQASADKKMTGWKGLNDLVIPIEFLRYVFTIMNRIRDGNDVYTDEAFSQEKAILISIAQKVLRLTTERERERFAQLISMPIL